MCPLWLCWALWMLSLAGPGAALTEEQLLGSLLQQLHLSEVPVLEKVDVGELAIPAHVRAQYVALLQRSHGDRSRGKRFSQNFRGQPVPVPAPHRAVSATVSCLRLVWVHESGWKTFDVIEAVNFWQQLSRPLQPLLLQVSVQREHLGPQASSAHKLVRFSWQGALGARHAEPQLELHTLDLKDYGAQGDCDPDVPVTESTRCCRQMYIDLQGMKWAENWVLEPLGFLAFECVGTCQQLPEPLTSKWPFLGLRQCIPSEVASLPVIISIREGDRTRPQVVSLPNMRVQKYDCASDGTLVPRRLEPYVPVQPPRHLTSVS
ncbi:left-right determination factor 2-like [Otolemur garnettii]|uniref:left-right determination factor 2-like n=1 Tax=Otolemur garnettii TaxID=30611 RepID=UPI0002740A6D|nr:left-right determination factor 2-like [Otolemur garnettii]